MLYRLAVAAIFKWEHPWILEWVRYHQTVGVEHFYLYANEEGAAWERSQSLLSDLCRLGTVTLIHAPMPSQQLKAYCDATKRARAVAQWLAVIDLDEFLLPLGTETISDVLDDCQGQGALAVNWSCFGSGGLSNRPESQIHGFLWRASDDFSVNKHVKLIVAPERVSQFFTPHNCNAPTVDERGCLVVGPFNNCTPHRLRINHYVIRSRQDFIEVKSTRGRAEGGPNDRNEEFFRHHDRNEIFDDLISKRFSSHQ
jgi:hypothetical protein